MLEIFASTLKADFDDTDYARAMQLIPEDSALRLSRFRFREDAFRSLFGELLIRQWCAKRFGMDCREVPIERGNFTKPYIRGVQADYSIAHSGDWVVCVVSTNQRVGIDLEQMKEIDLCVAERCFSEHELADLLELPAPARTPYFYALWTLKEAYVKYLGTGLLTPLDSFSFAVSADSIALTDPAREALPAFRRYELAAGYACAVCAENGGFPKTVGQVAPRELLRHI